MKKLSLIIATSVLAFAASAQGVFNANNNYTVDLGGGVTKSAFIFGVNGTTPVAKANGRVVILNAASGAPLNPAGLDGNAFYKDGAFTMSGLVVPGVPPNGTANIIIQAWDVTSGSTFATATIRAQGLVAVSSLGGGGVPNASLALNSNFVGLTLVDTIPEPSTVALAGLGLVGLLFVARRK